MIFWKEVKKDKNFVKLEKVSDWLYKQHTEKHPTKKKKVSWPELREKDHVQLYEDVFSQLDHFVDVNKDKDAYEQCQTL